MVPMDDDRLRRVDVERQRRELVDLVDDDFSVALRQAKDRLPTFVGDTCFAGLVRRLWLDHGDELPADLEGKYLALRSEVAWLEDAISVRGELSHRGIREVARLAVQFHTRHRHLAAFRVEGKP